MIGWQGSLWNLSRNERFAQSGRDCTATRVRKSVNSTSLMLGVDSDSARVNVSGD